MSIVFLMVAIIGVTATGWPIRTWLSAHENSVDSIYQASITGLILHGGVAVALAALGIFSLWLHFGIIMGVVGIAIVACRRHQYTLRFPQLAPHERGAVGVGAVILGIALCLNGTPSEVILGGRDAGIYANTGMMIARTGGIRQYDPIVADLAQRRAHDGDAAQGWSNLVGVQSGMRFMSSRIRLAGLFISETNATQGEYTPQFLHLFPAWIAVFASLFGVSNGILATGFAGVMGVWSVGMAGRAMRSPWLGVLAMAFLAINGVQVWFSRYPMSETTAQWLFFAIVYGVARMAQQPQPRDAHYAGLIAGAAAGQMVLARLDFVFVIAPFAVWLVWRWLTRTIDTPMRWVCAGLAVCGGHGIVHLFTISRNYFIDTFFALFQKSALTALAIYPFLTPALQRVFLVRPCSPLTAQPCPGESIADAPWRYDRIGAEIMIVLLLIGVLLLIRTRGIFIQRIVTWLTPWYLPVMRITAIGSIVVVTYAYFIRPQIMSPSVISALPTCVSATQRQSPTGACLTLQGYIGAPITPPVYSDGVVESIRELTYMLRGKAIPAATPLRDMYANSMANLVRVGWYISPFGIVLSAIGLSLWLWHGVTRRDWLFVVVTCVTAVVFIQLSYGTSSQTYIYIMRRYLPTVYPGLALWSATAVLACWGTSWWRRGLSVGSVLLMVGFLGATIRPVIATPEHAGAITQVAALAAQSTTNDITLIRGGFPNYVSARDASDVLALPLTAIHGRAVFGIRSQSPDNYAGDLATLYTRWIQQGRHVYFMLGANGALWIPGMSLVKQDPFTFAVPEFSQLRNQKPASVGVLSITYQRYELKPGRLPLPRQIDVSDTASQISGFYTQETIAGQTFAWTTGTGVLRFDVPHQPTTLQLTVAAGKRPASIGAAQVCIEALGQYIPAHDAAEPGVALGCFAVTGSAPQTIEVTVPADIPSSNGVLLIRIHSEPWIAAQVDPLQNDWRPLGIQFVNATLGTP